MGQNNVDFVFWDTGSGLNFETVNLAHAKGGTSTLRATYSPNLYQTFFDETLNKMLVYTNSGWKDFMGNNI